MVTGKATSEGRSGGMMRVRQGGGLAIIGILLVKQATSSAIPTGSLRLTHMPPEGSIRRKQRLENFFSVLFLLWLRVGPTGSKAAIQVPQSNIASLSSPGIGKSPGAECGKAFLRQESGLTQNCFSVAELRVS